MKKWMIYIATAGCLFAGIMLTFLYSRGLVRFNYPGILSYPVRGIDVSHHQGRIDWAEVRREGIHFAYIKASEGGDFKDPEFGRNWANAKQEGIVRGAYHFFLPCKSGKDQARNFIKTVPNEYPALPPVIDLELTGNCPAGRDPLKELRDFISEIETAYGRSPVIYVTYDSYEKFLKGTSVKCRIWIRDIYRSPHLDCDNCWVLWQYANRARLNGINKYVDLDVFNGSRKEFRSLTGAGN
jgi:lysozyme